VDGPLFRAVIDATMRQKRDEARGRRAESERAYRASYMFWSWLRDIAVSISDCRSTSLAIEPVQCRRLRGWAKRR
jgi:hypothetical protein